MYHQALRLFGLYNRTSKLQLPFTSLVDGFKVGKARLIMTLSYSKDDKVAGVEVKTGRKWSASKAVTEAESRLKHKDIHVVGTVAVGR